MEEERTWIEAQFQDAALGDVRRMRRVVRLAREMLARPGASLPQLAATPYDLKATYNLLAHPTSTPAHLHAGHRARVQAALHAPQRPPASAAAPEAPGATTPEAPVLLVEDTTVLSWAGHAPIAGLGPIGSGGDAGLQGVLLHSVLALRWATTPTPTAPERPPVQLLGVADQQYHVRTPAPRAERDLPAGSRPFRRQERWRESALWSASTAHLGAAPAAGCGPRWVRICDRGADVYEFLEGCHAAGHGYVVRAAQDRALATGSGGGRLFAQLRAVPAQAALALTLRAPHRPGAGAGRRPGLACTAVRVWEPAPPPGVVPLEWLLLSDAPVARPADAVTCVQQYATRWVIEEFHKVLKTGLGAERLQLEYAERLMAAIAVMSVVALRLLHLKEWVHTAPEAPAETAGLTPLEQQLLVLHTKRSLTTVRDVALALGRLGGHLNRTGDGLPGWLTLWRGLTRLQTMAEGAQLLLHAQRFG